MPKLTNHNVPSEINSWVMIVLYILAIVACVLTCLKLAGIITWSWWVVLVTIWIPISVATGLSLLVLII